MVARYILKVLGAIIVPLITTCKLMTETGGCYAFTVSAYNYYCMLMQVQITHRLAWRSSSPLSVTCTQAAIEAGTILGGDGGALQCQSGCNGNIGDTTSHCTEFSVFGDWSVGERTYVYSFNKTISYFETL